jgi:hypothetical protein
MAAEPQTQYYEINTVLMGATFQISGPKRNEPGNYSAGTAFLMAKPKPEGSESYYVLVSAAHVFEDIAGATATINIPKLSGDGRYVIQQWTINLRDITGQPLYVKHSEMDVAAVYISMPNDYKSTVLPTALLADDEILKQFEIHPGDELLCLGFPLAAATEFGFPILRSGKIASYPLVPTTIHKNILFDFRVFKGNSGGPVYFVDRGRYYGGSTQIGQVIQFVVGLVTSQLSSKINNQNLQLAAVVPAIYIRAVLDQLPAESPYK